MRQEFQSTHKDSDGVPTWTSRRYFVFTRFYNASRTSGMGLVAIGRSMRAAGFSIGVHRLFSWCAMSAARLGSDIRVSRQTLLKKFLGIRHIYVETADTGASKHLLRPAIRICCVIA
jgi:hypothetical protein